MTLLERQIATLTARVWFEELGPARISTPASRHEQARRRMLRLLDTLGYGLIQTSTFKTMFRRARRTHTHLAHLDRMRGLAYGPSA